MNTTCEHKNEVKEDTMVDNRINDKDLESVSGGNGYGTQFIHRYMH